MLIQLLPPRKLLELEVRKIIQRKFSRYLLLFAMIGLPSAVSGVTLFSRESTEGSYIDDAALLILSLSLSYIFLPLWVIILVGGEIKGGHSHRVIFLTSRKTYLTSKMVFCVLTAFLFSLSGLVTFIILDVFSPFPTLDIPPVFHLKLFSQCFLVFLCHSILLTSLVILIRNALVVYVGYFVWLFIENVTYMIFEKTGTKLWFLPVHLLNGLFVVDGDSRRGNYYMFFDTPNFATLGIIVTFLFTLIYIVYRRFMKTNLTPLSD